MAATRPSLQIRSSIYSNSEAFSSALLFCTHVEGRSPATPAKLCSSAPACVILSAVLQFADAGTARDVAAAFAGAIAPGSYLIISIGSGNRSEGDNFTSARLYIHSPEEIQSFFGGLELVPPGVIPVRCWYGDGPAPSLKPRTATFLGGVARKP